MVGAGVILGGKYQLISELGSGGMGVVWRAQRLDLDAPVAVKLMRRDAAANPAAQRRFNREAKSAAALRSPHVVQLLDYGVDEGTGTAFIVMELLEGESLRQRLLRLRRLSTAQLVELVTQVARGLTRAHALGIVHRDLKPENIFLVENEDAELVKLLDFGIAKAEARSGQQLTATGAVVGTPHYMSPEQIELSKAVDARADVWSLGVIACECLVGQRPFEADTLSELAMRICLGRARPPSSLGVVPAGFDDWFARATALDPERRFQSATELGRALAEVCTHAPGLSVAAPPLASPTLVAESIDGVAEVGAPLSSTRDARFELPNRESSTRRRRRWLGLAAGACALAGLVWLMGRAGEPRKPASEPRFASVATPVAVAAPEPEPARNLPDASAPALEKAPAAQAVEASPASVPAAARARARAAAPGRRVPARDAFDVQ